MRRGFERALDECLSQLNTGEFGLEEVLARYPEYETELRPLLRMAMLVRQVPQVVPSAEAKAAGRRRLLAAVTKKRREKVLARPGVLRRLGQSAATLVQPLVQPQRQPLRLAQAIAALLVVVSLIGAGTVGVAAGSLPDSPLYPIKRATERVQLALTTTAAGQARLHMDYSEKRLKEAQALAEAGKDLNEEATLQAMESENSGAWTAISQVSEEERLGLLGDFTLLTARQQVILEGIKVGVPPSDQGAVEEALEVAEEHQRVARKAMTEPDLLLTPTSPRPTDTAAPVDSGVPAAQEPTATPVPPTSTPIPVPTATPVPPTFTPIPVPTATPVPPTSTPVPTPTAVPTATETPQAEVTFEPTVEPTATETPQADVPFTPAVEATATPTTTATPTPTPTLTPTPTPMPTVEPTTAPTPQAEVPFQPQPASSVTNCRVSDAPQGEEVLEFPAGTGKVYVVFDYVYMAGEEVGIKVTDNIGHVLLEEVRTLAGDGTESISVPAGEGGFTAGPYLVNIYQGGGVIRTIIWDVAE